MAQAQLWIDDEFVRQRGLTAPRRADIKRWAKTLHKLFERDLAERSIGEARQVIIDENTIRMKFDGGISYYVDRMADPLART